jgi:anti-sigma-K factor RskA
MRSVAATAQDHREGGQRSDTRTPGPTRDAHTSGGWLGWLSPRWARGLAAASLAAVAALAAWNVTLQAQLDDSNRITRAVAEARAIYPVTGDAGRGLLLDTPDGPRFLAAHLETPPSGSLYVMWLIGPDGVPVDVGVVTGAEGVALVPLDEGLAEYTTFAVTVETARVDAPTTAPVLVAAIGGAESGS